MGDGKNLKKYLDEKGTNVRKIAKATGISATTLGSLSGSLNGIFCFSLSF